MDQLPDGVIVGNLKTGEVKRGNFNPDKNFISRVVESLSFMFKEYLKDKIQNVTEEELKLNLAI